jgi:hypothetical protein
MHVLVHVCILVHAVTMERHIIEIAIDYTVLLYLYNL